MISCCLPGIPYHLNGKDFRLIQGYYSNPGKHYTTLYGMLGHGGYDLAYPTPGQKGPIFAPHDGKVTLKDSGTSGLGRHVIIEDRQNGRLSFLGHLDSFVAKDGMWIHEHDQVGIIGRTGDATGVHVHQCFKRIDLAGNVLMENNGYGGCVPVGNLMSLWLPMTLAAVGV